MASLMEAEMVRDIQDIERDMDDPDAWGEPVRPRKSSKRQRDAVVSVRFSESELSAVQGLAAERSVFISTLLRDLALAAATVQPIDAAHSWSFGTPVINSSSPVPQQAPTRSFDLPLIAVVP